MVEGIVQGRQSIFDISLQITGSIENIVEIARANDLQLNEKPEVGSTLKVDNVIDTDVKDYLSRKKIVPVSYSASTSASESRGIGGMAIGSTFVIG